MATPSPCPEPRRSTTTIFIFPGSLLLCGAALMWHMDRFDAQILAQNVIIGADSFPLLAVPFFMLANEIINAGGISRRIIAFAMTLVAPGDCQVRGVRGPGHRQGNAGRTGQGWQASDAVKMTFLRHTRDGGYPDAFERFNPCRWISAHAGMATFPMRPLRTGGVHSLALYPSQETP